jgi:hypothetical protein
MKLNPEEAAKRLGVPVREVTAVDAVDVGAVVTGPDGHKLLIADEKAGLEAPLLWYGDRYEVKAPNERLPVYNPETRAVTLPKLPPKKS